MDLVKKMAKDKVTIGMFLSKSDRKVKALCASCVTAKMKRMGYANVAPERTNEPLKKVIADIGFVSISKETCYLAIIDEGSRYSWAFPMSRKADATNELIIFLERIELQRGLRIKIVSTDDDKMFHNTKFEQFMKKKGMVQQLTHPYCPEEVALVEKLNYMWLDKTRATLTAAGFPDELWGECLKYVVYTMNRTGSNALDDGTPYQALNNKRPNVSNLKPLGCFVDFFVTKVLRASKLGARSSLGIFVGYDVDDNGYRVLDLVRGSVVSARAPTFFEDQTVNGDYMRKLVGNQPKSLLPKSIPLVSLPVVDIPDTCQVRLAVNVVVTLF